MTVPDVIAEVKAGREVPRCQLEYAILVLDSLARPGEAKAERKYEATQIDNPNTPSGGEVGP